MDSVVSITNIGNEEDNIKQTGIPECKRTIEDQLLKKKTNTYK